MTIKLLKPGFRFMVGPSGNVSICLTRKPHIGYDLDMAVFYGIIEISGPYPAQ